jgi:predicted phage terminase large subunit-like protein
MEKVRDKCQSDHAFLAKCLGYTKFEPEVHGEVWDFFLKKDPSLSFEEFAKADLSTHDRALFLPRNGYKSTANMVDVVQIIICWVNITILIVTGKEQLGLDFIGEIRGHFERQKDGEPRNIEGQRSLFQLAFPEFCIDGSGPRASFLVPCRTAPNIKEDTVQFAGVETSQSGPHFDVIIFDDAITNENSKTPTRLISVRNQISYHRKMMNPYGYCTYIGTWYSPQDAYGFLIRAEDENKTLFWHKGKADSRDVDGRGCLTKIMLRPAMWEKGNESIDIDGPIEPKDWELWFPSRLTWKWLIKERANNRDLFHSQMMNNPNLSKSVRFTRDAMTKATRVFSEIPSVNSGYGLLVQSWDTAYSDSSQANYTVGLTALILGGRFYFVDMVRGQFSDFDVSRVVAENTAKWKPARVVFEDAIGVRWLAREIRREMERMNFYVQIEFAEVKNTKNRKYVMAAPVAKMFSEGRIILSNGIPYLDKVYDELEGFQNGAPNDDIVDAMALAINYYQYVPEASVAALKADFTEEQQRRRNRGLYNHFYGLNTGDSGLVDYSEQLSGEEIPSYVRYSPMDAFK